MNVIVERLERLESISLKSGAHEPDSTFCVMEAVAFVAGEAWSDHPKCSSQVIGAFLRSWNDSLPTDADRDRLLKPLIPKLVGTAASKKVEERRAFMAADWLVRVHTPAWLRLAGLLEQAELLAGLPEITSMKQIPSIRGPIEAVRKDAAAWATARAAAWDAARATARAAAWAGDAARAAAWAAARAAAWDAAGDAARARARATARAAAWATAWAAARAAAWAAARAAAWDAAWARDAARGAAWATARAAAWDKLEPVVTELQQSALELVERMIAV